MSRTLDSSMFTHSSASIDNVGSTSPLRNPRSPILLFNTTLALQCRLTWLYLWAAPSPPWISLPSLPFQRSRLPLRQLLRSQSTSLSLLLSTPTLRVSPFPSPLLPPPQKCPTPRRIHLLPLLFLRLLLWMSSCLHLSLTSLPLLPTITATNIFQRPSRLADSSTIPTVLQRISFPFCDISSNTLLVYFCFLPFYSLVPIRWIHGRREATFHRIQLHYWLPSHHCLHSSCLCCCMLRHSHLILSRIWEYSNSRIPSSTISPSSFLLLQFFPYSPSSPLWLFPYPFAFLVSLYCCSFIDSTPVSLLFSSLLPLLIWIILPTVCSI